LRVLLVCLFALALATQATAATTKTDTPSAPRQTVKVEQRVLTLDQRLERKLVALRKYASSKAAAPSSSPASSG
jgi:Flp pilus assembly protein CpaB